MGQHKDFSDGIGSETFGYVPQLENIPGFSFPLIISNIDDIDVNLMGWKDPNCTSLEPHRNYDKQNLIFDVKHEGLHRERNVAPDTKMKTTTTNPSPTFSLVKHYPPEWARRLKENGES